MEDTMIKTKDIKDIEQRRQQLLTAITEIGEMRPGSLVQRHRRCGKVNCHCAESGDAGHSDWILTRGVGGKTMTKSIPVEAVERTQAQIREYRRFREMVGEFVEVCEQRCDSRLAEEKAVSEEAAKKRASKRSSRRR
jgi:hypothetical protein